MNKPQDLTTQHSFPPIADPQARCLILGSMPGVISLQQQQYYAHPRNAFWPIMSTLFGIESKLPYKQRCLALVAHNIAVWDVLKACQRPGSLDQNIVRDSIVANDFSQFLQQHPRVKAIFFNGTAAETLFKRHALTKLPHQLTMTRLPSTSPAHASMTVAEKTLQWAAAFNSLPSC